MSDITMCLDKECPSRLTCHRFTATADSDGWQSYGRFKRAPDADKCDSFLTVENEKKDVK